MHTVTYLSEEVHGAINSSTFTTSAAVCCVCLLMLAKSVQSFDLLLYSCTESSSIKNNCYCY